MRQVHVGAPPALEALHSVSALIVDAESMGDEIPSPPCLQIVRAVLGPTAGESTIWNHYNDPRLNGPATLNDWQHVYGNVELISQESITCSTLADLLNQALVASQTKAGVSLTIRKGNPLSILKGSGRWMQSLQFVQLIGPLNHLSWRSELDTWLSARGFRIRPGRTSEWVRDEMATLRLRNHDLDTRIRKLQGEIDDVVKMIDSNTN